MYSKTLSKIVVWKKSDNSYYYKIYRKVFLPYELGERNRYNHEVICIIDDLQEKKIRKRRHFLSQNKKNKIIDYINRL